MGAYKINPQTGLKEPTKKQRMFIDVYLKTFSILEAARAAGYSESTESTLYTNGKHVYNLPHVKAIIDLRRNDYLEQLGFSKERVIAELCKQSFSDIGSFLDWETEWNDETQSYRHRVSLKDSNKLDTSVIKSVKINKNGHLEIDLCDKQKALDNLVKILGLTGPDKLEISGPNGGAIKIDDLRKQLEDRLNRMAESEDTSSEECDSEQFDGS